MLPAFIMGRNPLTKIIQTSHTAELSQRFGRKTKQLIDSFDYKKIFPETALQADSKAAGRWDTSAGGEYFAAGVGGAITGGVADLTQLFTRPVARLDPYGTPNPRIFICSASTPPGGGVHGMCGWHAAQSAQRRLEGQPVARFG